MENATKALLIAAAVLMSVMLLTVIFVFKDKISAYFSAKHEVAMTQQMIEFNNKFENYRGQTIRGNELISLLNRIIEYNEYQSDIVGYERIKITIDFKGHQNEIKYNNESGQYTLITGPKVDNKTNDDEIGRIATTSSSLSKDLGITDVKLQKLSAQIANIVDDEVQDSRAKEDYKKYRAQLLTRILGYEVEVDDSRISDIKKATYQYYQFTQFKRAMFKCTEIQHNTQNGRVNEMKFEVVLENDKIKFE